MNKKNIVIANLAVLGVMVSYSVIQSYRLNKQLNAGYAEMQKPLPSIGKEYLRRHRAYFNSPKVKETNAYIDSFISEDPNPNL